MKSPDDLPAERLKELRARLGADDEQPEPPAEALIVWKFIPMQRGLPGWRAERVRRLEIEGRPPATRSAWRPVDVDAADEDVVLMLDTYECSDRADAREWLLSLLASVQSTAMGRLGGEAPGDLAFGMPEGGSVVFARANLVCQLRNGGRAVRSVVVPARSLDRWVAEPPQPNGRLAPEFSRVEAGPGEAGEGDLPLQLEARDPADRPVWLRISAPTGALALVGGQPRYRRDPDAAPATITVAAIGEGGVAVRTIEVGSSPGRQRGT
jgi:hypothetical protein